MTATQVHVRRDDLNSAELVEIEQGPLAEVAVRLEVESFSVTSNNITYAVVGAQVGYWNFFPAPEGFGIVPMWGHARVIESRCPEIAVGERVYGYLPMASHLDVVPGKVSASGFVDISEHRQPLPPIYNQYARLNADPEHDPARENERMIFGPLFKTGFLIEYFMRSNEWFGAGAVILTSASSKTAMGLASVAMRNSPQTKRIGLTSAGNVEFVRASGLYDEVLPYEEVTTLAHVPSVSVDFAGNAGLLKSLHEHLGDQLKYSCLVGVTHIEERGGKGLRDDRGLPGPKPTLFFAPDHIIAFYKEHGPQKAGGLMAEAWHGFLQSVAGSVAIERHSGLEAARQTYLEMVGGTVDPAKGIVIEP
ncbi:DUF2855 family protein [Altererythrobacter sp. GH1-8]|uniref:DUF2855 family protein n=1 Tax=Altererythrobacter sp. GH1-8 TaxID=3349333 RepID=UPI00374D74BA